MSNKSTLKRELAGLVIHTNDSVKGFEKAAECVKDTSSQLTAHFLDEASARKLHVDRLNSRLKCIGEDEKERRSLEGGTHRALISLKNMFTSSDDAQPVVNEAIRGEEMLVDYIKDTFDDVDEMDGETQRVIKDLRASVSASVQSLKDQAKAA